MNQGSKGNIQRKGMCSRPEYHLDLPLKGDSENILDIRKESKLKGFLLHLFPFIIVISLSNYGVIEVGLKYCSHGQMLKKDGQMFSL